MPEVAGQTRELEAFAGAYIEYAAQLEAAGDDADEVTPPEIPPPFRSWLEFLFRVERKLKTNPELSRTLHADTAAGLEALEAARNKFARQHKQCPRCGRFAPRAAGNCGCGQKF